MATQKKNKRPSRRNGEVQQLREQVRELRAQLDEARQTLTAIREGGADALPIETSDGPRIFTLESAEQAHRKLDSLESGVRDRTARLQQANERLEKENEERLRTEQSLRVESARLDALLGLSRMSEATLAEIAGFILEHGIALTGSRIGFVGFLSEDEAVYTLHAVSKEVVKECSVAGDPQQWHVAGAGIWAEAIRERKTLFVNDYDRPHLAKKGLPAGHPPVRRFMVVPLFDGKRIVALAGVGNKPADYNKADERQIALLLSGMWSHVQRNSAREALLQAHDELERTVRRRTAELARSNSALQEEITERNRVEQALRQRERRYRELVQNANSAIIRWRRDGTITFFNEYAQSFFGYAAEEAVGRHVDMLLPQEESTGADLSRLVQDIVDHPNKYVNHVNENVCRDGRRVWMTWSNKAVLDERGRVVEVLAVGSDITDRKHAEAKLRESEDRFRRAFANATTGFALRMPDGGFVDANPAYCRVTGYGMHELRALDLARLVHPDDLAENLELIARMLAGRIGDFVVENRYLRKDSSVVWVRKSVSLVRSPGGEPQWIISLVEDITQRKQAEEALRQALTKAETGHRLLEALMKHVPEGITIADANGRLQMVSRRGQELLGGPHAGKSVDEVVADWAVYMPDGVSPMDREDLPLVRAIRKGETVHDVEIIQTNALGDRLSLLANAAPILDEAGAVSGAIVAWRDITARKRAQEALRQTTERYALLSQTAGALLAAADPQAVVEELCRKVMAHLGCDVFFNFLVDEANGRLRLNACAGIPAEEAQRVQWLDYGVAVCGCVAQDGKRIVAEDIQNTPDVRTDLVKSYGVKAYCCHPLLAGDRLIGTLSFGSRSRPCFAPDEVELMRVVTDQVAVAMERIRAEREMRNSENRFRTAQDLSLDAFTILSAVRSQGGKIVDFRWEYVNRRASEILRYRPDELVGENLLELLPGNRADLFPRYVRVVETGEPHDLEIEYDADGIHGWFRNMAVRLGDGIAVYFSEITERKTLEQQRERLLEAERAARMEFEKVARLKDEFLATVSHELRSPLNAIMGWTGLLARGKVETTRAVDIIQRSTDSLVQIVEDLLDMSRIVSGKVRIQPRRVNVAEIAGKAAEVVQFSAQAKDIELNVCCDAGLEPIECDPNRIQQIIWNLLTNAVKFTPNGGQVHLAVSQSPRHVIVTVADTGKGITPEFLPHLFEQFRQEDGSIARRHGGLGLGLSIVKHLVELHGGTIEAHSEGTDRGAMFIVRLPRSRVCPDHDELQPSFTSREPPSAAGLDEYALGGVRILAVDDDPCSRDLLSRVMSDTGARVRVVESADQADEVMKELRPDVLISDIGMPEEDGFVFIRRLRSANDWRAELPAIAVTAFGRPEDRDAALRAGFDEHVGKPFDPGMLCILIRDLLRKRGREVPAPPADDDRSGEQAVTVPASVVQPPAGSSSAHILLAEDNALICDMLRSLLEEHGYRVSVAGTVAEGMAIADQSPVDILLSDLRLKDGNGWDLLGRLQSARLIPAIAMSGYSDKIYVEKSKAAGFSEYLVKPVEPEELIQAVRKLLGRQPEPPLF